jgi:hypothetical protein
MLAKSTYIPLLAALAIVPILTDCNRGEPDQDDTSQVKFTVPSDNLPAECAPLEPSAEADAGAGTAQGHDGGADALAPDGGVAPVDGGGEGQDGDAGTTTGPRCLLTITLKPSGGGRAVWGTAGIDQDNPGQMSLSVPSGEYQVTATVTDASDTVLFQLASSPVTHVFEPGVTVLTVWLNEVMGETTPTEFTPLHIASLMAKDQEPDDDGDEYRVRPNGLIDLTVGVSGTTSDATVTVTGRVDTQSGNCGSFSQFVPVESSQNVFTGNWRAGNITDVTCTLTITATQVASNGEESNTASISFQVMTYSGEGGGTNRSFVAVLNRGPVIADVGVSPTQINLANSPLEPIEVNVTGTDEESQELGYALSLATSLRRQGADEQHECLLLEPVAGETNGSFVIDTPRWGECPELEEGTEFVDYVEGPSVVVFDVTVTDEPAPGALTSTPLSAHAKLSLPVMRQGVAN